MRAMRVRWILASTAAVALACVGAAQPAWAGGDKEEKGGQREEFHVVIDGLEGELLERAAGELKEHHPAVKVRIKEGVLKLYSEDGAAWKKAMHALTELGVPVGPGADDMTGFGPQKRDAKELRIVLDGKERKGPPSDKEIEKKIGALEEKLVAAREGGREREVQELEQALEHLRKMRKELAGVREKHTKQDPDLAAMRKQLEEAKRALHEAMQGGERGMPTFDLQEAEIREMKRHLEAMGREMGAERKRPGPQGDLRQRMEHTRQALKHLKEARLPEQAQQVERALHRMEMAAEGEGRGPDMPHVRVEREGQHLLYVEVERAAEGSIPGPPRRAPAQARPAPPPPPPQECPPPSVGGFRRGPIHPRPQAQPPRQPFPPPPGADRRPIGQGRVVAPDGAPQPAVMVLEGQMHEPRQGPAKFTVLRAGEPARAGAVRAAAAPLLVAPAAGPRLSMAGSGDVAASVEQLRAEMAQLRAQLHLLMHRLAEDDDDDDDEDEKRSPRR